MSSEGVDVGVVDDSVLVVPGTATGVGTPFAWDDPASDDDEAGAVELADIDGDGTDDVLLSSGVVLFSDGDGFEARRVRDRGLPLAAELNGDDRLDAVFGSTVFINGLDGRE